jgi:Flp pilus assembly protein TadD
VGYHVHSFALLAVQCALLLLLFRRLLGSRWLALLGAALYGLHGAIGETVNYVVARSDILSTFFAVAAVWLFAERSRPGLRHLHLLPAALAVLAKEQGAMAAPILVLHAGLFEQRRSLGELLRPRAFAAALRPALPAILVSGAGAALGLWLSRMDPGGASHWRYAAIQPFVLLRYLGTFLAPFGLSADTDWQPAASPWDWRVAAGLAGVAGLAWLAFRASRVERARPVAFGLAWFFLALLPSSSLVPLAEVTNDHRMYFPFVGLSLAAACGAGLLAERWPAARRALPILAPLLLAAHGVGVHLRNRVWRTEETLWRDVTEKSPGNGRGFMNLGLALMGRGDYPEAERCFRRALELAPRYGYAHVNLAILSAATGRPAEAEREFRLGMQLMPGVPSFRFYFARWLDSVGRAGEALPLLREAAAAAPADPWSRQLLMEILARRQAWAELDAAAADALRIDPAHATALRMRELARAGLAASPPPARRDHDALLELSLERYQASDFPGALRAADEALALRPASALAQNNRCAALNRLGRHREAVEACEEALRIDPGFERARNNLGYARERLR